MRWLDKLLGISPKKTANLAKERLQVIVAHERKHRENPQYLVDMQKEIVEVIAKYFPIPKEKINVEIGQDGNRSVLELNVAIPEQEMA